jgi:hypothetical protein
MIRPPELLEYFIFRGIDYQPACFGEYQVFDRNEIWMCEIEASGLEENLFFFPGEMNSVN